MYRFYILQYSLDMFINIKKCNITGDAGTAFGAPRAAFHRPPFFGGFGGQFNPPRMPWMPWMPPMPPMQQQVPQVAPVHAIAPVPPVEPFNPWNNHFGQDMNRFVK